MADRDTTSIPRARARSKQCDLVAAPAHEWEYRLPANVLEKPRTKAAMIETIARMMAAGEWRTGISASALGRAWGMAPGSVQNAAAEASRAQDGDPYGHRGTLSCAPAASEP